VPPQFRLGAWQDERAESGELELLDREEMVVRGSGRDWGCGARKGMLRDSQSAVCASRSKV
jgi:hypothetical protein